MFGCILGYAPPALLQIQLSSEDHEQLQTLLSGGVQPVRSILRALSLIQMVQGVSAPQIARLVPTLSPSDPEDWPSV